jgi:hypothetical protein
MSQMSHIARLLAIFTLVFATGAWATDDATLEKKKCDSEIYAAIERDLRLADFTGRAQDENERFIVSQACKTWPYKPEFTLVALAYDAGVEYEKELVVAVFDKKKKRVVSSYQRRIEEDALTTLLDDSLGFDTARYQLAENMRAFGLRFHNHANGPRCRENFWNDQLTLFVPEGKSLRPVLSLYRHRSRILGCDSACIDYTQVRDESECITTLEDSNLSISIDENIGVNGFHDLRVTANISTESFAFFSDAPRAAAKEHVEQVIFRYNGKRYEPVAPWWSEG